MFDYNDAFSRNLGWVTEDEQAVLRSKRVAIAGLGGVGGSHLLTLTRLGIGHFNIADLDVFEAANFNRQAGAFTSTLGKPKIDVLANMALDINPELEVGQFPEGINADNMGEFLDGVDLYVDSLDFFAFEARMAVFAACAKRGIPAITAAPLGMGSAFLCFMPGKMSFEEYFRLEGHTEEEQALRLMLGLSPALLQMGYLVDDSRVDFNARKGPSTPMACEICAGLAGAQAIKILLNRGDVICAPRGLHFDAYKNKLSRTWRPWGNNNPIQRLGLAIARNRVMGRAVNLGGEPGAGSMSAMARVLDFGRWAPSGDNEQPWQFELLNDREAVIHAHDTRDWCLYDLDGHSSQIAVGALMETVAIAAGSMGMQADFELIPESTEANPRIRTLLSEAESPYHQELFPYIRTRTTQRRPLSRRALEPHHKEALSRVVGEGYKVIWLEGNSRLDMAKLLFKSAHIRLTTPEGYDVHRKTIDWGRQFSETRIPEKAVGVDWFTLRIMRWALQSWERVKFLNRFFAGTWLPRLQMDLMTGVGCAAHFVIVADGALESVTDYLDAGRVVQRFWLEATRLGLQFQPEMTPLIFSRYVEAGLQFTEIDDEQFLGGIVATTLSDLVNAGPESSMVFMGRVGYGKTPVSRSIRRSLDDLSSEKNDLSS